MCPRACGNSPAQAAAASAGQLPAILDALQQTYEYVIVDCGSADVAGLTRISDVSTANIIDINNPADPLTGMICQAIIQAGLRAPLVVSETRGQAASAVPVSV